jgi:hypothetical protein
VQSHPNLLLQPINTSTSLVKEFFKENSKRLSDLFKTLCDQYQRVATTVCSVVEFGFLQFKRNVRKWLLQNENGKSSQLPVASKTKYFPLPPYRRQGGEKIQLLFILDFCTGSGEWSASRPGRTLTQRKDPRYPLDRRLGGPQLFLDTEARGNK